MKIIAHRGAGGEELENSLSSIKRAFTLDVDAVEFDVRTTSDNVLVVLHDATTKRTGKESVRVNKTSFAELNAIELRNGQKVPTLEAVLRLSTGRPALIDIKDAGTAEGIVALLRKHPKVQPMFVSYHPAELARIHELLPGVETYLYYRRRDHWLPRPYTMLRLAKQAGVSGIAIDRVFLNPIIYRSAMREGMRMYVYSIDSVPMARAIMRIYPQIDLCTNHPERLNRHFKPNLI